MFGAGANPASDATLTILRVAARGAHRRQERADAVHDPEDVHVQDASPLRQRRFHEAAQERDAGVVHEHVHGAHVAVDGGRERVHGFLVRDVAGERVARHAGRDELGSRLLQRRGVDVRDHEPRTALRERRGALVADARRRAGD